MSRVTRRAGSKRSAKINPNSPSGHNQKRQLYSSWFKRRYGKALQT